MGHDMPTYFIADVAANHDGSLEPAKSLMILAQEASALSRQPPRFAAIRASIPHGHPWIGVIALIWAILYQQVENLTIEPKINARAINVHPAVAFASVMLGASLFGVAGALLAVPVAAMAISLIEVRKLRYEIPEDEDESEIEPDPDEPSQKKQRKLTWKRDS